MPARRSAPGAGDRRAGHDVQSALPGRRHAARPDLRAARPAELGKAPSRTLMNETRLRRAKFDTGFARRTRWSSASNIDHEDADLDALRQSGHLIVPTPLLDPDPFEAFPGTSDDRAPEARSPRPTRSASMSSTRSTSATQWSSSARVRFDDFRATLRPAVGARTRISSTPTTSPARARRWSTSRRRTPASISPTARRSIRRRKTCRWRRATRRLAPEKDRTFESAARRRCWTACCR